MPHPDVAGTHLSQKESKNQTILGLQTPATPKANRGGRTRWGRLAPDRAEELLTTPHSARKLEKTVGLPADKIPKIIDRTTATTPPSRCRSELLRIKPNENDSPIKIMVETDIPSPCKNPIRRRLDREFSAAEIRCVNRIPLTHSSIKTATKRISADDIEKAQDTPRQFKKELRVSADIATSVWGTDSATVLNEGVFVPKKERTHLILHSGGGDEAIDNLVYASGPANSKMIGGETGAKKLVEEKLCNYVDNTTTATLRQKPGSTLYTHHADQIEMTYKPDNTGLIFQIPPIDADLNTRPSVGEIELTETFMVECQKAALEKQAKKSGDKKENPPAALPSKKRKARTIESFFLCENSPKDSLLKHEKNAGSKSNRPRTQKASFPQNTKSIAAFFSQENQENSLPSNHTSSMNGPIAKRPRRNSTASMNLRPISTFFAPNPRPENPSLETLPPLPLSLIFG